MIKKPYHRKKGSPREFRLSANVMEEEAWDDAGPNMKISKAFVVVLILHVVAVAGLAAFSFFEKKGAPAQSEMDDATLPPPKTPSEIVNARPVVQEPATPSAVVPSEASSAGAAATSETASDYEMLVVDQSAALGVVATRYGLTEEAIIRYNPTLDPSGMIMAGTKLKLPKELVERQRALAATQATPEPEVLQPQPRETVTPPRPAETVKPQPQPRPASQAEKPVVAAKPVTRSHTIQKGENLYRIAKRYGVSVDAISKANGISDPAKIAAGETLIIPSR